MKSGLIHSGLRISIAQLHVRPGQPAANTRRMIELCEQARTESVDLLVFPELAVPGYLLGDEWERPAFLRECERCTNEIAAASHGITVVFGNVAIDWSKRNEDGRARKYNALFVAEGGRLLAPRGSQLPYVIKTLMPNYRQFDDSRHFFDLRKLAHERGVGLDELVQPVDSSCGALGCLLCEDGWDLDYAHSPLEILAARECDLFVNISASPFTFNKNHKRNRVFNAAAVKHGRPLIYANQVSLQNNGKTVFAFDGSSCIYDGHGNQLALDAPFRTAVLTADIVAGSTFGQPVDLRENDLGDLLAALEFGAKTFLDQIGVDRVTIGASGGIDSALAAAIYSRILPEGNLLLVNMPSRYNSPTTRALAAQLADNLGARYATVPIEESVALTSSQVNALQPTIGGQNTGEPLHLTPFMLENVQARDRSSRVLSAVSNAFGGVFTCNANKSEVTVGYGTLYGDICGFFALLADLWKTEVWALSRHLNEHVFGKEIIPTGSIDLVPSAELSAEQDVDAGRGDPLFYPYHDRLFASWVERWNRATPEEILEWYAQGRLARKLRFEGELSDLFASTSDFVADLERWWNLYQGMALAKRIQAPPIMAVKRRAFGFDHREAQLGPRYTRRYTELRDQLLADA